MQGTRENLGRCAARSAALQRRGGPAPAPPGAAPTPSTLVTMLPIRHAAMKNRASLQWVRLASRAAGAPPATMAQSRLLERAAPGGLLRPGWLHGLQAPYPGGTPPAAPTMMTAAEPAAR